MGCAIVHYLRDEKKVDVDYKNIFINWNVDNQGIVTTTIRVEEQEQVRAQREVEAQGVRVQ
jgi:hypothetical protein